ncbi:MAG: hypothetical protein JXR75_11600 [Rhodobacteraceae bacterium]|nr:hypothetical protein [Paracoccaceae bacterium]
MATAVAWFCANSVESGDPAQRDPALIDKDVRLGRDTADQARKSCDWQD